jgi:hypothetical protein
VTYPFFAIAQWAEDLRDWLALLLAIFATVGAVTGLILRSMRKILQTNQAKIEQIVFDSLSAQLHEDKLKEALRPVIREEVENVVDDRLNDIRAELKPNGGSSFRDQFELIKIMFTEHLRNHENGVKDP